MATRAVAVVTPGSVESLIAATFLTGLVEGSPVLTGLTEGPAALAGLPGAARMTWLSLAPSGSSTLYIAKNKYTVRRVFDQLKSMYNVSFSGRHQVVTSARHHLRGAPPPGHVS